VEFAKQPGLGEGPFAVGRMNRKLQSGSRLLHRQAREHAKFDDLGGTVKDADTDRDTLAGSAGDDWFFLDTANDRATDLRDEVFASDLDWITNDI
jgi:hypothetical protein